MKANLIFWALIVLGICGTVSHSYGFADPVCTVDENGNVSSNLSPFISTDPEHPDFLKLRPNACAVDRGATIPEVKTDFRGVDRPQGKAYDIGAYEYVPGLSRPKGLTIQ
jgi:hypothetical protein